MPHFSTPTGTKHGATVRKSRTVATLCFQKTAKRNSILQELKNYCRSKNRIHDALFHILDHFIKGVEIESINEQINYSSVILLLTPKGYAHEEVNRIISQIEKDIKMFLAVLVEDGKRQNEIRHDFSTENIVDSLYIIYMGIQYYWLIFPNDDINSMFEKNFDIAWKAIEPQ